MIECAPFASASSDLNVEKPSACPPAATNTELWAAIVVVVLVMMFVERTLPALASASTVNDSVPLKLPLPALTVAILVFEEFAASVFQAAGRASRERGGAER